MHSMPLHWHQTPWWQYQTKCPITSGYTKGFQSLSL